MLKWIKDEAMLWRGAYVARTRAILDAAAIVGDALTESAEIGAGRGFDDEPEEPETPEQKADAAWSEWAATCGLDERDMAWAEEMRSAWLADKGEVEGMSPEDELTAFGVPREAWG